MRRLNITYSVTEDKFEFEINKLISSAEPYLSDTTSELNKAKRCLEDKDYELGLEIIANVRNKLAQADLRLHDVMNVMVNGIRSKTEFAKLDNQTLDGTQINNIPKARTEKVDEIKRNLQNLGIDMPDNEIESLLEGKDD